MTSNPSIRAELLVKLRLRLEAAEQLSREAQAALKRGDALAIDEGTSRLETLLLEFRVLESEYRRLPALVLGQNLAEEQAREALQSAALRIARSAAIGSGLLARLVGMARQLLDAASVDSGGGYTPRGRAAELPFGGTRLRETV